MFHVNYGPYFQRILVAPQDVQARPEDRGKRTRRVRTQGHSSLHWSRRIGGTGRIIQCEFPSRDTRVLKTEQTGIP